MKNDVNFSVQLGCVEGCNNLNNLYVLSLFKAFKEFIVEEVKGNIYSEARLNKKIEAARMLFPEHRRDLRSVMI